MSQDGSVENISELINANNLLLNDVPAACIWMEVAKFQEKEEKHP